MKVLILGVNGFIGSNLTHAILTRSDWEVYGMDMGADKLGSAAKHERFHFVEGDISINKEWIAYHVKKCDVVMPLVAIATPITYVKDPLRVFNLDFEENLAIIRLAQRYGKRVLFPSTSEVYGMCPDEDFDPETSNLVYGPISKERWIYACSKQLLDRVIWAMGNHGDQRLRYTIFRPFNFVGPGLDSIHSEKEGSSRVLTQFLGQLLRGEPIQLVDGGSQRRCFIYISDAVDALMRIIANENGAADGKIFNIGNPAIDLSVKELAERLVAALKQFPEGREAAAKARIETVSATQFYGANYQDMNRRKPSIRNTGELLGWKPSVGADEMLQKTVAYYLHEFNTRERSVYDHYLRHPPG